MPRHHFGIHVHRGEPEALRPAPPEKAWAGPSCGSCAASHNAGRAPGAGLRLSRRIGRRACAHNIRCWMTWMYVCPSRPGEVCTSLRPSSIHSGDVSILGDSIKRPLRRKRRLNSVSAYQTPRMRAGMTLRAAVSPAAMLWNVVVSVDCCL